MANFGIIKDGSSDFLVIKKLIECILLNHKSVKVNDNNFIEFDIRINDPLNRYIKSISNHTNISYNTQEANNFINSLISAYWSAYTKFSKEFDTVTNNDIIIINTDSEKIVNNIDNYFLDWAYHIRSIINFSIEKFYNKLSETGYSYNNIPSFIPLIFFPSSEILVASCKDDYVNINYRSLKPRPDLKIKLYGTDSILEAYQSGILNTVIDNSIVSGKLINIYQYVPEVRPLFHSLTL